MIDWSYYSNLFPANEKTIWLNNCGTTPISTFAFSKVNEYLVEYSKFGTIHSFSIYSKIQKSIKSILASLLHCETDELAIIHNTSEGMNFISRGIELSSGDEILLLENEYPANVYPWDHWKEKAVQIHFVKLGRSQNEFLENLKSTITEKTKLVSFSAVHWGTGLPLPLKEIGVLCKDRNILFAVDGAQGIGHIPIDVQEMNISYLSASGWKWLLGPLGVGILYINSSKPIKSIFKGTQSVSGSEVYLPYKNEFKPNAEKFEFSTPNFTDWVYFEASLNMLSELGFESVMKRINELSYYLYQGLESNGFTLALENPKELRGILSMSHSKVTSTEIHRKLLTQNIVVGDRIGFTRFSPHVYNTFEQLDRVISLTKL
ncbi:MAG: aminotransferase class V-fold PLP-dependent enzyme [Leptospiraceae bacterium]|nr:aminotransferase class V-fold PLP-dependent enzyme [Leptospiraceae bacterium]